MARGTGEFQRFLSELTGNIASPIWLQTDDTSRLYFVSDHEGVGNLYSCLTDGSDLRRHTDHEEYYVRNPSSDGRRIVYHAGADLFVFDPIADVASPVPVAYHSPRIQRGRKFSYAGRYLNSVRLHPTGNALAVISRGKPFTFFNFDGPVLQQGKRDGVRYRLVDWLNDDVRVVLVSDEPGEEVLEVHSTSLDAEPPAL